MSHLFKSISLLILLLVVQIGFAQKTGTVKFFVDVDNGYFEIEINDTMLLKRYKDTLPAGTYSAKVWSPGYIVTPISFDVVAGKTTEKHIVMAKNADFIRYELDYKKYNREFHKHFTVPLTLTLVSAISSGLLMVNTYSLKKTLTTDIAAYYKSPYPLEIDGLKADIVSNNRKYNINRNAFYVNTGITAFLIGGSIWSYINFKKNYTEPTYNKDSPFKDKYSLNITPFGCTFALHL